MQQENMKLKTSISLPKADVHLWKYHAAQIQAQLPAYLRVFHKEKIRRIGLKTFNVCPDGVARINVFWEQDLYNQLHALAHALCISVSHLLWRILKLLASGIKLDRVFSNYEYSGSIRSPELFILRETITFRPKSPPRNQTQRTP